MLVADTEFRFRRSRRRRCRVQLAFALLDPSGAEMALHCNADMVRTIVGARPIKFLPGPAGSKSAARKPSVPSLGERVLALAILWRRVAGGLTPNRQETLLAGELNAIHSGRASPELIRLAGSLERLPRQTKADLIETLITQALQHCAPYLAALGLLLNRSPFHAGPESVVPPEMVAPTYAAFQDFDWAEAELLELHMLFFRAARVVGDRSLDVPKSLRNQIDTMERAGVAPGRTGSIKAFTPVGRAERSTLYGESLPPGLLLGSRQDVER